MTYFILATLTLFVLLVYSFTTDHWIGVYKDRYDDTEYGLCVCGYIVAVLIWPLTWVAVAAYLLSKCIKG